MGGNNIIINKDTRGEMTFSKYMQRLLAVEPELFSDKLRATNNADEILRASRKWVNEAMNHPRNDDIIDFARGTVQIRVGSNDYTAEVLVGNRGSNGLLLYDILNLTRTNIQQKETGAEYTANTQQGSRSRGPAPVNRSIPQPSEKNNNNFSLATDSAGKALTEQQKDFFKDSKNCQRNVCYGPFCKRKRRTIICGNYYG